MSADPALLRSRIMASYAMPLGEEALRRENDRGVDVERDEGENVVDELRHGRGVLEMISVTSGDEARPVGIEDVDCDSAMGRTLRLLFQLCTDNRFGTGTVRLIRPVDSASTESSSLSGRSCIDIFEIELGSE